MTRKRLAQLLYRATYMVIRRGSTLPSVEEFLDLHLGNVLAEAAPSDWPSFWEETLTIVVEDMLRREGYRIDELEPKLFARKNRSMRTVLDWMAERIMPLKTPAGRTARATPAPKPKLRSKARGRPGSPGSHLLILLTFTIASLLLLGCPPAAASEALLERTPYTRIEAAEFSYEIAVSFKDKRNQTVEIPLELVLDPTRYDLRPSSNPEQLVQIRRVVWRGVGDTEGHTIGALLFAKLDPDCSYTLRLSFPSLPPEPIEVEIADDAQPHPSSGFVRFVRFVDRHVWGTCDLRTLEGNKNTVGVDFRVRIGFPVARRKLLADA
ncbi:MAG: hypothetical protein KAY24_15680, partial [Candidatus Eisenbacteria sp.]|nr:hypothetical protein [Candidatus Eisenbacteria bacterium]